MARFRAGSAVALGVSVAMLLAACGGGSDEPGDSTAAPTGDGTEPVTLTWWHNGNNDPLLSYWQGVADAFTAENPNVTIEIEAIQNEDLRTRLQVALQSNDPPDVLPQWGGGEQADQVAADKLMDLTDLIPDAIESLGGAVGGWTTDGAVYGVPYTLGVGGFWYNKAMFAEAGIEETPATWDEFFVAIDALKAIGVAPIAVGAGDGWPAGWWYYFTAVKACSPETLQAATSSLDFTDECFIKAGELLQEVIDAEPFNEGFLATPAQQGATSASGLVANRLAAMQLMGHWDPSVMKGLTEDELGLGDDLGWFAFPDIDGTDGTPGAIIGGGDGFSCAKDAPAVCADFLAFIVNETNQNGFGATGAGLPTLPAAATSVEDPNMATLLEVRNESPYVQLYLDTAFGTNIGTALNDAVVNMFAGEATPQDIVDAMVEAAATV